MAGEINTLRDGAAEASDAAETALAIQNNKCLNCGGELVGHHCHHCGQKAQVHRNLSAFWHDFLHSILHFEGKVWRTLPLLFFKPGDLTRRFVHGERAKFVSPLALFLFSVFLMFGTFNSIGGPIVSGVQFEDTPVSRTDSAKPQTDVRLERGKESDGFQISIDTQWFDHQLAQAKKNPELLFDRVQSSAYKYSWILILFSVPLVRLLFLRRPDLRMFDHVVFVTYSIAFATLLLVLIAILRAVGLPSLWLLLAVPVHMFFQLKSAYEMGVLAALWRMVALVVISFLALLVFAAIVFAMGAAH
jgi:hypothetical protein